MNKNMSIRTAALIVFALTATIFLLMELRSESAGGKAVGSPADFISGIADSDSSNDRLELLEDKVIAMNDRQDAMLRSLQELVILTKNANLNSADEIIEYNLERKIESDYGLDKKSYTQQDFDAIKEKDNEIFNSKETNFLNEELDDNWRENEEVKITSILEQDDFNQATLNSLECRQTSCRADITHTNSEAANEFLDKFIRLLPNSEGQFKLEKQDDGTMKTVLLITPPHN